ncbi:hypothetical protein RugamoR57_37510 [Duganella caerulea]
MRKFTSAVALVLVLATSTASAQWYVGGTLHRATLSEWTASTSSNQLATLADIVGKTLSLRDPVAVRPMAEQVQACINVVAANKKMGTQPVADTAVGCMFQLGYLPK